MDDLDGATLIWFRLSQDSKELMYDWRVEVAGETVLCYAAMEKLSAYVSMVVLGGARGGHAGRGCTG